jgi:hypothetical protein
VPIEVGAAIIGWEDKSLSTGNGTMVVANAFVTCDALFSQIVIGSPDRSMEKHMLYARD